MCEGDGGDAMWVFGYGSLMWDGWEAGFGCTRRERAILRDYRRDFSKASVKKWGTPTTPCPTLGLASSEGAACIGMAFEFSDEQRDRILEYLDEREGRSFALVEKKVHRDSGMIVALVAIDDSSARTFIGDRSLEERARFVTSAEGVSGTCLEYVKRTRAGLIKMGIDDPAVETFWSMMRKD